MFNHFSLVANDGLQSKTKPESQQFIFLEIVAPEQATYVLYKSISSPIS